MLKSLLETNDSIGTFLLRLTLGGVFFPHGAQKLLGWFGGYGFSATMGAFTEKMHIPAPFAVLAIAAEFLGALGLIFGCFTRVAAFGIGVTMAVAVFKVHLANGFFMNWSGHQPGEGFEYHLLVIGMALALILQGGGKWSLDALLARRVAGPAQT